MPEARPGKSANIASLQAALGHTFADPGLLVQALTHRSQSFESGMEVSTDSPESSETHRTDNERLEFLGDAILGLIVAENLFESHPNWQEGELTRLRAQLVSRKHMAEVAESIHLGDYLLLGRGEERSGGRRKSAILANAMEAVLAAVYLDSIHQTHAAGHKPNGKLPAVSQNAATKPAGTITDGLLPIRRFAQSHILGIAADNLARELRAGAALGDHKSALQEYLQSNREGVPAQSVQPVYTVQSESGPDHRKRFQVAVRLKNINGGLGEVFATGSGSTKKKAEQEAARSALIRLTEQALSPHPLELNAEPTSV